MQILHSVYLFTVVARSVLNNTGRGAKNGATLVFLFDLTAFYVILT